MTGSLRRVALAAGLLFVVAATVAAPAPVAAIEVSLGASRTRVGVGEQFTISVEATHGGMGKVPEPQIPAVQNVRQVTSYSSRNFAYVNGRATSSLVMQYVMVADEPGTYTIGPATVVKGGEQATSGSVRIEVSAARSSASTRAPGTRSGAPVPGTADDRAPDAGGDDLLVFARVDDDTPWVGQQVTFSFTFLRRVRLLDTPRYTTPDATGLWSEDIDTTGPTEVMKDGRRYHADRIRTAFFPTGAGDYTIGEAFLTTTVEDPGKRRRRDPFDLFGGDRFGLFRSGRDIRLRTSPIALQVQALPEDGKPEGFSGAVGVFSLVGAVDHADPKAGDPVTLRVTLEGEGNVKVIPAPDLGSLEGFKVYASETAESTWVAGDRIVGRKTWEYVLVPTVGGEVEIAPVSLAVFDPQKGAYDELRTELIRLDVEATALDEALARGDDPKLAKERVRLRQRDIRWIQPAPRRLRNGNASPLTSPGFLLAHLVPVLAFAGSVGVRRHRRRLRSDVRWARARGASRAASRRLGAARERLDAGDLGTYFGELSSALRGYVADRLHLAAANLDETEVREALAAAGGRRRGRGGNASPTDAAAHDPVADELFVILEACDSARFSPLGGDPVGAAELHRRATKWITREEKR